MCTSTEHYQVLSHHLHCQDHVLIQSANWLRYCYCVREPTDSCLSTPDSSKQLFELSAEESNFQVVLLPVAENDSRMLTKEGQKRPLVLVLREPAPGIQVQLIWSFVSGESQVLQKFSHSPR